MKWLPASPAVPSSGQWSGHGNQLVQNFAQNLLAGQRVVARGATPRPDAPRRGRRPEHLTALKPLGKAVEFVRFPNSNHAFPRTGHPRMREEYLTWMLDWFDDWLA